MSIEPLPTDHPECVDVGPEVKVCPCVPAYFEAPRNSSETVYLVIQVNTKEFTVFDTEGYEGPPAGRIRCVPWEDITDVSLRKAPVGASLLMWKDDDGLHVWPTLSITHSVETTERPTSRHLGRTRSAIVAHPEYVTQGFRIPPPVADDLFALCRDLWRAKVPENEANGVDVGRLPKSRPRWRGTT